MSEPAGGDRGPQPTLRTARLVLRPYVEDLAIYAVLAPEWAAHAPSAVPARETSRLPVAVERDVPTVEPAR